MGRLLDRVATCSAVAGETAGCSSLPALPPAGGSDDEEGGEADVRRRLLRVAASLKPSGPLATAASFDLRAFCGSPLGTLL